MDLTAVRGELAAALAGVDGVTVYANVPATPQLPSAVVQFPFSIDFGATLAGHHTVNIALTVYVPLVPDVDHAQTLLATVLLDAKPLLEQHDPNGVWIALDVDSINEFRTEAVNDTTQVLAADLNLTLIA